MASTSSNARLDRLFARWKRHYESSGLGDLVAAFSEDGLVEPERFEAAPCRILFVLKETNDYPGGDLRAFLRDGPKYQMWHTIARWAQGLLDGFSAPFEALGEDWSRMNEALRSVAVLNLKKATGGSSADMDLVSEHARRDRHFIRDEIALIDPDVVVACGVRAPLVWLQELDARPGPLPWAEQAGRVFLFTRHPARAENRATFDALRDGWRHATAAKSSV